MAVVEVDAFEREAEEFVELVELAHQLHQEI